MAVMNRASIKPLWTEKVFEIFFINSWWVWLFLFFCFCLYLPMLKKGNREIEVLQIRHDRLAHKRDLVCEEKEDLTFRLQSQSDPAWIEQVLIRELGVVPKGYLKVHFKPSKG